MALKLFFTSDKSEVTQNNKIISVHDASDGTYYIQSFYITNENDTDLGYSAISISLKDLSGNDLVLSEYNGIFYQLLAVEGSYGDEPTVELPDIETWENVLINNDIMLKSIPSGAAGYRFFLLRTYVPRGTSSQYLEEAKLVINALEV
jgi:hypothetical protein